MLEEGPGDTISAAGSNRSDSVAPGVVAVQVKPDQRVHVSNLHTCLFFYLFFFTFKFY